MSRRKIAIVVCFLGLFLYGGVQIAEACGSPPPPQPPITIQLHEVCFNIQNPKDCMIRAWVIIHGYFTFGSTGSTFCACALRRVPRIKKVLYARFVDPVTGLRLPAFCFDDNAAVGTNIADLSGTGATYDGFLAPVFANVPAGTTFDLHLEVLLQNNTTASQLGQNLSVNSLVGTGKANSTGAIIDHFEFLDNGGSTCQLDATNEDTVFLNGAEALDTNAALVEAGGVETEVFKACPIQQATPRTLN